MGHKDSSHGATSQVNRKAHTAWLDRTLRPLDRTVEHLMTWLDGALEQLTLHGLVGH